MAMKRTLLILVLVLALCLAALAALWMSRPPASRAVLAPPGAAAIRSGEPSSEPMALAEGFIPGGPFSLIDQNGAHVTLEHFAGSYIWIFFGYTFCPDICPTTLGNMVVAMEALNELDPNKSARLTPIFVTVDPARDTANVLHDYVGLFHPRLVGLTGSDAEIEDIKQAYKVFAARGENIGEGYYLVDHSAFTYLMGPDGAFVAMFPNEFDPQGVAASISKLMDDNDR